MKSLILAAFAALTVFSAHAQSLTIIHLNDTHSHIDPQRSGEYVCRGGVI